MITLLSTLLSVALFLLKQYFAFHDTVLQRRKALSDAIDREMARNDARSANARLDDWLHVLQSHS